MWVVRIVRVLMMMISEGVGIEFIRVVERRR